MKANRVASLGKVRRAVLGRGVPDDVVGSPAEGPGDAKVEAVDVSVSSEDRVTTIISVLLYMQSASLSGTVSRNDTHHTAPGMSGSSDATTGDPRDAVTVFDAEVGRMTFDGVLRQEHTVVEGEAQESVGDGERSPSLPWC